ncbi:hypothetical protein RZO50_05855 [Microbacterium sp. SSW1-59]|uniref:hypothetical protein n=1 Tax=Microbacterium xanthum TaxID=3079794 RepID=UPI002AD33F62|nr:hypothetical protein [Microbacterium sp. SSW1-59]MDZ8201027.1 hypothetical protein [Microbacterium sp. SSW1-59]
MNQSVRGFVGVYRADGGPIGELRYVIGHMLGTAQCSLCDITHTWRRKPEWDAMVARLGVPFELRHLNEMDADVAAAVAEHGAPAVFTRTDAGLVLLLDAAELDAVGGSVADFERAVRATHPA